MSLQEYHPPAAPMPLVLSLLQESTRECVVYENITIVPDHIRHLPCRNSKTWRKDHGWSDLEGDSNHSTSRWDSSIVSLQSPNYYTSEEEVCPAPPSPPKRQNSVSSTDMSLLAQARRQHSSSSLLSTSSSSTASSMSSRRKKFQYPPTLGQLPEDSPASTTSRNNMSMSSLPIPKPPRRQESDASSAGSANMPCKPQRQASEQSFSSQQKAFEQRGSDSSPRLHIPLSLFAAPNMPQRQESVSTLGSRQSSVSTLSTQESNRSLMTNSERESSFRLQPTLIEEEEPKEYSFALPSESSMDYSPPDAPFAPSSQKKENRRSSFVRQETQLQRNAFLPPSLEVQ